MTKKKQPYHHGNLRETFITKALLSIEKNGINNFSLRQLSMDIGISRAGAYHHFRNKNEILCAVAQAGFSELEKEIDNTDLCDKTLKIERLTNKYLNFAIDHPEQYELMFGDTIWKNSYVTEELKKASFQCFKSYKVQINNVTGLDDENTTRNAQIIWGMLHGMSKLIIDKIFIDTENSIGLRKNIHKSINRILNV
jgi:AcrR family transcriptional regulator